MNVIWAKTKEVIQMKQHGYSRSNDQRKFDN